MNTLTTEQLKSMQEQNEDFLLINTLDEQHFPKTRIANAVNIPQSRSDFVDRVTGQAAGKDHKIVVYCAGEQCDSSSQAARKLEAAGFTNVFDYPAGAEGWQQRTAEVAKSG